MNEGGETEFQRYISLKKKKQILKEPIAYHFITKSNISYYLVVFFFSWGFRLI